jgi:hypothetical protein
MSEVKKAVKMPSTEKTTEKKGKAIAKQNTTVVQKCTCVSDFQDKMYGVGMRIKNSTGSGYRCTVCSK